MLINACLHAASQHQNLRSIFNRSIELSALEHCPAGYDIIQFPQDKNATNPIVIQMFGNSSIKDGLTLLPSKQHNACQIIGDSGAAQHCRGLDDIPLHERCNIRKADVPLIFVTANGEVRCDEVIATDIPQLGITRDMYVMKDSPSVI